MNPMETLELPTQAIVLDFDSSATREIYRRIHAAPPFACDCNTCNNWRACDKGIPPKQFLELLTTLAVNFDYPAEVYHLMRTDTGLHLYGGWYHFVGAIRSGMDNDSKSLVYDSWAVTFHDRVNLVDNRFDSLPTVQLEFSANMPWVLPTPEPD